MMMVMAAMPVPPVTPAAMARVVIGVVVISVIVIGVVVTRVVVTRVVVAVRVGCVCVVRVLASARRTLVRANLRASHHPSTLEPIAPARR
jgi:hypothetical protein